MLAEHSSPAAARRTIRGPGTASLAVCVACLLIACSSGSQPREPAQSPTGQKPAGSEVTGERSPDDEARRQALDRLSSRQQAACDRVGNALLQCAIEDARENMTAEELAELDLEQTGQAYKTKFVDECLATAMSQRQVEVFEACLADTTCAVFVPCLDTARPHD